jgi:HD-like signal output (HDOD) protein/DNA-binding response OmpR family regulator
MTRVLLVEEATLVRESVGAALRATGFEVDEAWDVRTALGRVASAVPDVAVIALDMADGTALHLTRRLRSTYAGKSIKVMIVATSQQRSDVVKAAHAGVQAYLVRSHISLELVVERIKRLTSAAAPTRAPAPALAGASEASDSDALGLEQEAESDGCLPTREEAHRLLGDLKPLLTRGELRERLEGYGELQAMPPVVSEVLKLTRSASASLDDVVKVVKRDQGVSLKILRLANSSAYDRGGRVDSIERAVGRIGLARMGDVVTGLELIERFDGEGIAGVIDHAQFWTHSIAYAILSSAIAERVDGVDPGHAFTMGLLHDLGRLVFADVLGDQYAQVVREAQRLSLPLEVVEARRLILTHADGIEPMLRSWHLPPELTEPLINHHVTIGNARKISPKRLMDIATVGLANRLCHAMLLGTSGNDVLYPTEPHCRALGLAALDVREMREDVESETALLRRSMLSELGARGAREMVTEVRQRLDRWLTPLCIGPGDAIDPARVFFNRLSADAETPNLAVIRIDDVRAARTRIDDLIKAEREVGVISLPSVILADSEAAAKTGQSLRVDAAVVLLPATVDRVIDAVRRVLKPSSGSVATAA